MACSSSSRALSTRCAALSRCTAGRFTSATWLARAADRAWHCLSRSDSEPCHIATPSSLSAPVQPRWANRPSRHCGTGKAPDRDVTGSCRDVNELCASLPAVPPGRARAHRGNCRLFDTGRKNLARDRLFAGGRWIRTFGTAEDADVLVVSVSRSRRLSRRAKSGRGGPAQPSTFCMLRDGPPDHSANIGSRRF